MPNEFEETIAGDPGNARPQEIPGGMSFIRTQRTGGHGDSPAGERTAMALKDPRRAKSSASRTRKSRQKDSGDSGKETVSKSKPISRKKLLEKALRIIEKDLDVEGEKRPTNTVSSLVQLLKLDRSFREDEEQPHEIRVVWEEKRDEKIDDSAENSKGSSHET